jgi:hypothetical protein
METAFAWAGVVLLFFICLFIAFLLGESFLNKLERMHSRLTADAIENGRKNLGQYIRNESYWFSESDEAFTLMQVLGEHIQNSPSGLYQVDRVRDDWRSKLGKG